MTNRIDRIVVVLAKDVREDDMEGILTALQMVKGVAGVAPHVADGTEAFARVRVKHQVKMKLYDAIDNALGGDE